MDTILRATLFNWILLFALRLIGRRAAKPVDAVRIAGDVVVVEDGHVFEDLRAVRT